MPRPVRTTTAPRGAPTIRRDRPTGAAVRTRSRVRPRTATATPTPRPTMRSTTGAHAGGRGRSTRAATAAPTQQRDHEPRVVTTSRTSHRLREHSSEPREPTHRLGCQHHEHRRRPEPVLRVSSTAPATSTAVNATCCTSSRSMSMSCTYDRPKSPWATPTTNAPVPQRCSTRPRCSSAWIPSDRERFLGVRASIASRYPS